MINKLPRIIGFALALFIVYLFIKLFLIAGKYVFEDKKTEITRGNFTLIEIKYEEKPQKRFSKGFPMVKYDLLYNQKKINYRKIFSDNQFPIIKNYKFLDFNPNYLLLESGYGYCLLMPNGNNIKIRYLGQATYNQGLLYKRKTDLINDGLLFHQNGMLINLKTNKKIIHNMNDSGTLFAVDDKFLNLFYFYSDFNNLKIQNPKKTFSEIISDSENKYKFGILKWNLKTNKIQKYIYKDSILFEAISDYQKNDPALSSSFTNEFANKYFKWIKDNHEEIQLLPKNATIQDIDFE